MWRILGESSNPEDHLNYVADRVFDEPLTKVKWLTETALLVATTHGNLYKMNLKRDDQNAEYLSEPQLLYKTTHEVSIWDVAVLNTAQNLQIWLGEDSGKVT